LEQGARRAIAARRDITGGTHAGVRRSGSIGSRRRLPERERGALLESVVGEAKLPPPWSSPCYGQATSMTRSHVACETRSVGWARVARRHSAPPPTSTCASARRPSSAALRLDGPARIEDHRRGRCILLCRKRICAAERSGALPRRSESVRSAREHSAPGLRRAPNTGTAKSFFGRPRVEPKQGTPYGGRS
jgi:hypothetical protein